MAKPREPRPRIRKIGEHLDTITVDLTAEQVEAQRAVVCDMRDRQDALEAKLDSIKAEYKGKQKELEEAERVARKLVSTRKRDVEVMIGEYLQEGLDGIQVVRRREDTMEQIGEPRAASAQERQESLPLSGPPDDGGFGSS